MRRFRFFAALLSALLFVSVLLGATPVTHAQPHAWAQVSGVSPTVTFNDVVMLDTQTAWAVGQDGSAGVIYRLNLYPAGWVAVRDASFASPLQAITAVSPNNIWAVGAGGMFHKADAGWELVALPVAAQLSTIQLLGDGSAGWAGGAGAPDSSGQRHQLVLRYQGGSWQVDPFFSAAGQIQSLHFADATSGWAVGSTVNDRTGIWRFHDGRWSSEDDQAICDAGCGRSFARVQAIDDTTAWAVGTMIGMCAICSNTHDYLLRRDSAGWHDGLPYDVTAPFSPNGTQPPSLWLNGLAFSGRDDGLAVGSRIEGGREEANNPAAQRPQVLRYHSGTWAIESLPPVVGDLLAVSMPDASHALAVGSYGLILSYGDDALVTPPPTAPVNDPQTPSVSYFAATGHTLRGLFRDYWNAHGGLMQFGNPLTEEFAEQSTTDGKTYLVQYFERARFELHEENLPPYNVLLGLLGRTITATRNNEAAFQPVAAGDSSARYFAETGHHLAPEFAAYWQAHGGLAIFGYPISEAVQENEEGHSYLVQYFERNRFEYHPENAGTPYDVLLGRLGAQVLGVR
jgi:hypothetical protein